jgi:hypothetical protein
VVVSEEVEKHRRGLLRFSLGWEPAVLGGRVFEAVVFVVGPVPLSDGFLRFLLQRPKWSKISSFRWMSLLSPGAESSLKKGSSGVRRNSSCL